MFFEADPFSTMKRAHPSSAHADAMRVLASAQARVEEQSVILLELNANVRRAMEALESVQQQEQAEGNHSPLPAATCASAAIPAPTSSSSSASAASNVTVSATVSGWTRSVRPAPAPRASAAASASAITSTSASTSASASASASDGAGDPAQVVSYSERLKALLARMEARKALWASMGVPS